MWGRAWAAACDDARWLLPLCAMFVAKGVLLALIIAPFTGHDEVDHFFYIERLASGDGLGVFGQVMLPPEAGPYKAYVADYPYNAEVIQAPLYHVCVAAIAWLSPGSLTTDLFVLRLISVGFGLLVVLATYALARELFPSDTSIRAGACVFVALQPQLALEAAIVNHDILVILLATVLVWVLVANAPERVSPRAMIAIGGIAGAGILTKVSFGLMLPVVAAGLWLSGRRRGDSVVQRVRSISLATVTALVIASPWFVRSLVLYGDPTGTSQLRTIPGFSDQAQSMPAMLTSPVFWRGRIEDFWGNYGWRLIPFDPGTYRAIEVGWFAVSAAFVMWVIFSAARSRFGSPVISGLQWDGIVILVVWIAAMVAGVLYVGTIQFTQSRFAFPAMAAFGIVAAVGMRALTPDRFRALAPVTLFLLLLALNVVTMIRFVLPFYAGYVLGVPQ